MSLRYFFPCVTWGHTWLPSDSDLPFPLPKVELRSAVEEVVKETPEYRCMQSQFSVLYNESLQLKAHLDEARTLLHGTRGTHQRQVELIEVTVSFSLWVWDPALHH